MIHNTYLISNSFTTFGFNHDVYPLSFHPFPRNMNISYIKRFINDVLDWDKLLSKFSMKIDIRYEIYDVEKIHALVIVGIYCISSLFLYSCLLPDYLFLNICEHATTVVQKFV